MLELSDKDVKTVMRGEKKRSSISNYHYTIINKQMRKKVESLSKELNGNYTIIQLENTITEMKSLVEGLNSRMQ